MVEDQKCRDELWQLAAALMNSDFRLDSLAAEPSLESIVKRGWWVAAQEGGLREQACANISKICGELEIQKLVGVLIERIYESEEQEGLLAVTQLTAEDLTDPSRQQFTSKQISYVAVIDTSVEALINYSWDFPLSLVIFPITFEFFIYQDMNEATVITGPKAVVEEILGTSIEDSLVQFDHYMNNAGATQLAKHLLDSLIHPANASAKQYHLR